VNTLALNWLDWTIIAILGMSTLLSLWRGFVREALSLMGWVVAFMMANLLADRLAMHLNTVISNEPGRQVAAYVIVFIVVLLLVNLIANLMSHLIKLTGLSALDRLLGTVFGFARGLIILLVIAFVVRELVPHQDQHVLRQSQLMPYVDMLLQWGRSVFGQFELSQVPGISI
jgi:membrane protein required for colicin V production